MTALLIAGFAARVGIPWRPPRRAAKNSEKAVRSVGVAPALDLGWRQEKDSAPMSDAGEDALILDSLDRFLERAVKPQVRALEAEDVWPATIVAEMQALGLFGATIAAEYGGLGLGAVRHCPGARPNERVDYLSARAR
jgi:alkylation response protein AidB-like acyl-CoA dehydrogenase